MIWPSAIKTTRSATCRAKPISWVTTTMVMLFSRPRRIITSSTSLDGLGVQRRRRLVEQDDPGLGAQGPGNGDPLLLAAGQGGGVGVRLVRQAHHLQIVEGGLLGLGLALVVQLDGRQRQILEHRHVGIKVELLEHHRSGLPHQAGPVLWVTSRPSM